MLFRRCLGGPAPDRPGSCKHAHVASACIPRSASACPSSCRDTKLRGRFPKLCMAMRDTCARVQHLCIWPAEALGMRGIWARLCYWLNIPPKFFSEPGRQPHGGHLSSNPECSAAQLLFRSVTFHTFYTCHTLLRIQHTLLVFGRNLLHPLTSQSERPPPASSICSATYVIQSLHVTWACCS